MAVRKIPNNPRRHHFTIQMPAAEILALYDQMLGFERKGSVHAHHMFHQVFFFLEGRASIVTADWTRKFTPGESCIIPLGMSHQINAAGGAGYTRMLDLRIAESNSPLSAFIKQQAYRPWGYTKIADLKRCTEELATYAALVESAPTPTIHCGILAVVWRLFHIAYETQEAYRENNSLGDQRLAVVDSLMRENLHNFLAIEHFAEAVHLSRSQLSRLSMRCLGVSPAARYRALRLERACELLRATTLSIAQIAESCGFKDANHFSRVFKKTHGKSPTKWRTHS